MHADGVARDRIIPERSATALRGWEQAELLGVFIAWLREETSSLR